MSLYSQTLPFDSVRPIDLFSWGSQAWVDCWNVMPSRARSLPSSGQPVPQCAVQTVVEVDILLLVRHRQETSPTCPNLTEKAPRVLLTATPSGQGTVVHRAT